MKKILYTLTFVALFFASCEKRIDMDFEYQRPLVVAYSQTETGEQVQLSVTMSRPVFGYHANESGSEVGGFPLVENAVATLTVNGTDQYQASRESNIYTFNYVPQTGDRMELKVTVPEYAPLTAETSVPSPAQASATATIEQGDYADELVAHITLTDPSGEENYYAIRLRTITEYSSGGYTYADTMFSYFSCSDPLFVDQNLSTFFDVGPEVPEYYGTQMMFDDSRLDGLTHTIDIRTYYRDAYEGESYNYKYDLFVTSYSKSEYYYLKSTSPNDSDLGDIIDFFSEPNQVYTNFEGGCGVFGTHHTMIIPLNPGN